MGALTNKPMAFNSRNWEYTSQLTYDLTDYLTPRIRIDQFNGKVYRILPTVEWISNRIRFLYLGLRNQRIQTPTTNYSLEIELDLRSKVYLFSKRVMVLANYEKSFEILRKRMGLKKKKTINVVHGSIFDADISGFKKFENKLTKLKNYSESMQNFDCQKLTSLDLKDDIVLVGINPRMESPLLDLKIKELNNSNLSGIGNFSYSYKVKVLGNNTGFFVKQKSGVFTNSLFLFGLSSIKFADSFPKENKLVLVPVYMYNNQIYNNKFDVKKNGSVNSEDVMVFLANQNKNSNSSKFSFVVSSHFEEFATVNLPISGYLETNFKYFDNQLNLKKINSLKPNFGLNDLLSAFSLYLNFKICDSKLGHVKNFEIFKKKIENVLITNSVPNYLIRDSLGRANPLFKIS